MKINNYTELADNFINLEPVLNIDSNVRRAIEYYKEGLLALHLGDYSKTLDNFDLAIQVYPSNSLVY